MYAIVQTGGKQYRVKPGDTVAVEKLEAEPGEMLDLGQVLLVAGTADAEPHVGSPSVAGAVVRAEVLAQFRGEKIIVFRYKSKVRYRRKTGHRQSLTRLRIMDILLDGTSSLAVQEPATVSEPVAALQPEAVVEPVSVHPVAVVESVSAQPVAAVEPVSARPVDAEPLEGALAEAEEPDPAPHIQTHQPAAPIDPHASDAGETPHGS